MPYERIPTDEFEAKFKAAKPIKWKKLYAGAALDAEGERFCNNDVCTI
jgi:hypothetical protein